MKKDVSFYEVYGKANYTFSDYFAMGGNVFYSPNFLNSGAEGTYASITAKITAPGRCFAPAVLVLTCRVIGRQWLGSRMHSMAPPSPLQDLMDRSQMASIMPITIRGMSA